MQTTSATELNMMSDHPDLKQKTDMHWARKIWHMVGVSMIAVGYHFLPSFWAGCALVLLWFMFVPIDILRLRIPALNDLMLHVFKPIMRKSESNKLAGTSYLITGVLVTYWIFPREIFIITLLYLAFADPIASIFGIKYGRDKIFGHKSVQGSLAAFTICTLSTFAVLYYKSMLLDRILIVSLFGGLIGALAEAIPIGKIDDNFSIPVVSATGLWILFFIFGGFTAIF